MNSVIIDALPHDNVNNVRLPILYASIRVDSSPIQRSDPNKSSSKKINLYFVHKRVLSHVGGRIV
jgi:hypothetical protein